MSEIKVEMVFLELAASPKDLADVSRCSFGLYRSIRVPTPRLCELPDGEARRTERAGEASDGATARVRVRVRARASSAPGPHLSLSIRSVQNQSINPLSDIRFLTCLVCLVYLVYSNTIALKTTLIIRLSC